MWQMPPPVNLVRGTTGGIMASKLAAGSGWSFLCEGGGRDKASKSLRRAYTSSYIGRLCDARLRGTMVVGPAAHAAAARCIQYLYKHCLSASASVDL